PTPSSPLQTGPPPRLAQKPRFPCRHLPLERAHQRVTCRCTSKKHSTKNSNKSAPGYTRNATTMRVTTMGHFPPPQSSCANETICPRLRSTSLPVAYQTELLGWAGYS